MFVDGSREWPQLGGGQKFVYLFPLTVLACLGVALLILGVAFFDGQDWEERLQGVAAVAGATLLPWAPYFLWRWHLIRKSKERFARHQVFGDTDEFILST